MNEFAGPFDKVARGNDVSNDAVTVLNCTWSDLTKSGALEKHQDAARRAYNYFKSQSYQGPKVMVMVDSSAESNAEMVTKAAHDPDFLYFHIPDRDNVSPDITSQYPQAAKRIKPSMYFKTDEFKAELADIRLKIDSEAKKPFR